MEKSKSNSQEIIKYINDIINKKFSTINKGYNPTEVDRILDSIIEKFSNYINMYDEVVKNNIALKQQIVDLNAKNEKLLSDLSVCRSTIDKYEKQGYSMDMFNSRLSNLEEIQKNNKLTKTTKKT